MKRILFSLVTLCVLSGCSKNNDHTIKGECSLPTRNTTYAKKDTLEKLLASYASQGVPGVALTIYSPTIGYWGTAKGSSKKETNTPMELCNLQYLQSISKVYMATAVLKLYEQGKINLDAPVTNYLPEKYSKYIDKAETIKVRNLLNHTSGVPEYSDVPAYTAYLLAHPEHSFTSDEFLSYIKDEKLRFTPGSKCAYTNTNYHLLALIGDAVAGDHAAFIQQSIFKPLRLSNTFYRSDPGYLNYPSLVNSYLDLTGSGVAENVTPMQRANVGCSKGDDGIVATPVDAINFLKALMQVKILSAGTMHQMTTVVNDENGDPVYGLGLSHISYNGNTGFGHSGAGIGGGSGLYYFPGRNIYIFLATNIGTIVDGPIVQKVNELQGKVLDIVLKD